MRFSAGINNAIENVIKISLEFEEFPGQDILVRDLNVHACVPKGTERIQMFTVVYIK